MNPGLLTAAGSGLTVSPMPATPVEPLNDTMAGSNHKLSSDEMTKRVYWSFEESENSDESECNDKQLDEETLTNIRNDRTKATLYTTYNKRILDLQCVYAIM